MINALQTWIIHKLTKEAMTELNLDGCFVTQEVAAKHIGVSVGTFANMIKEGTLPKPTAGKLHHIGRVKFFSMNPEALVDLDEAVADAIAKRIRNGG